MQTSSTVRGGLTDWARESWTKWWPSIGRGRIEVGNLVIVTRAELSRIVREHHDDGIRDERLNPGTRFISTPRQEAPVHQFGTVR